MTNKSPSFQFYPDKYIAGTDHLSGNAAKAYMNVLCWMWLHSKNHYTMKDTDAAWRKATRLADAALLQEVRAEIMDEDFSLLQRQKRGNLLVSLGLKKEAKKQQQNRKNKQRAAKLRWGKDLQASTCNAPASFVQCSPSPSPSPITPTEVKKNAPPQYMAAYEKFRDGHLSCRAVPYEAFRLTLQNHPKADIDESVSTMLRHYAGANIPRPLQTLENFLSHSEMEGRKKPVTGEAVCAVCGKKLTGGFIDSAKGKVCPTCV